MTGPDYAMFQRWPRWIRANTHTPIGTAAAE
jgi:hypothetical protein